jgi:hypothetical protein
MDFSDPIQNLIICTLFGPFKWFFLDRLDSMERMTNIPAKAITEADISGFFWEYAGKINTYLTNHYNSKK